MIEVKILGQGYVVSKEFVIALSRALLRGSLRGTCACKLYICLIIRGEPTHRVMLGELQPLAT